MKDLYKILDIPASSSPNDIKKAYRKLSKKYHPDMNRGDKFFEEKFKDILDAYAVLKDPLKRKAFDAKLEEQNRSFQSTPKPETFNRPSPPPAGQNRKNGYPLKDTKPKIKLKKKDYYIIGGAGFFLIMIMSFIVFLEKEYYQNDSYLDVIDTPYETHAIDSANLIKGFSGDTLKADTKAKPKSENVSRNFHSE